MKFSKNDFRSSIITGVETGFIAWLIAGFLGRTQISGLSLAWLVVIVPVLWIAGVNFGYFLGRFFSFFNQFGRFTAVGFTNAAVDFGVLYLLIWQTDQSTGYYYAGFKGLSFIIANIHSYFWNKRWVFDTGNKRSTRGEVTKFAVVTTLSALINVSVASLVNNISIGQVAPAAWAGVGAAAGSAAALIFSFVGFRLAVFKKSS